MFVACRADTACVLAQGRLFAALAASAIAIVPAVGEAKQRALHAASAAASCSDSKQVRFAVGGELVKLTADDPAKKEKKPSVTLRVTGLSTRARRSERAKKGTRFTVPASDGLTLRLDGYTGSDVPVRGDRVTVTGRIVLRPTRCIPDGAKQSARYGAIDARVVAITNR